MNINVCISVNEVNVVKSQYKYMSVRRISRRRRCTRNRGIEEDHKSHKRLDREQVRDPDKHIQFGKTDRRSKSTLVRTLE